MINMTSKYSGPSCTHCKQYIYTHDPRKKVKRKLKHLQCGVKNLHDGAVSWIKSIAKNINNNL